MKLDRNTARSAPRGKYALLLVRKLKDHDPAGDVMNAVAILDQEGLIDWGEVRSDSEFFVMRLRDRHAEAGLAGYAGNAWRHGDREWAKEVWELADRAGPNHRACKLPD